MCKQAKWARILSCAERLKSKMHGPWTPDVDQLFTSSKVHEIASYLLKSNRWANVCWTPICARFSSGWA